MAMVVFAATSAPFMVATAQETPSPNPSLSQPLPPKANLPDATVPPGAAALCEAPGPPTRIRIFALQRIARTRFVVRFIADDRNFAGAVLVLERARIVDASALVLDSTSLSGTAGVFLSHIGVPPGRYDLAVRGWEYVTAPPSCWKRVEVTFRNVVFPAHS